MSTSGKIIKINKDLGYGFAQVSKLGEVFFSSETKYSSTDFGSLKVNDLVQLVVVETERGLFAESLGLNQRVSKGSPSEISP